MGREAIEAALMLRGYSAADARKVGRVPEKLEPLVDKIAQLLGPEVVPERMAAILDHLARRPAARAGLEEASGIAFDEDVLDGQYRPKRRLIEFSDDVPDPATVAHEAEHAWQHHEGMLPPDGKGYRHERVTARGDTLYSNWRSAYLPSYRTDRGAPYPSNEELIDLDEQRFDLDRAAVQKLNTQRGDGWVVSRTGEVLPTNIFQHTPVAVGRRPKMTQTAADLAQFSLLQRALRGRKRD